MDDATYFALSTAVEILQHRFDLVLQTVKPDQGTPSAQPPATTPSSVAEELREPSTENIDKSDVLASLLKAVQEMSSPA